MTHFKFELDGDQGSSGTTPLNLLLIPVPTNDGFTSRISLPSEFFCTRLQDSPGPEPGWSAARQ